MRLFLIEKKFEQVYNSRIRPISNNFDFKYTLQVYNCNKNTLLCNYIVFESKRFRGIFLDLKL